MLEDDQVASLGEDPVPSQPDDQGSVWETMRQAHTALTNDREPLELEVGDGIIVRYRYVPLEDTEASAKQLAKIKSQTQQAITAAIDTLQLACDEILVRLPDGVKPLADPGTPPVRFDHRLAAGMGWPDNLTGRQIVYRLFGGKTGEYRIIRQAERVTEWMAAEGAEVADDFLGG